MAIDQLPLFPTAGDPDFEAKVDAVGLALQVFVPQVNATAAALTLNSTNDSSLTSNTLSTGSKTFTVSPSKSFQPGMYLIIADTAAPATNSLLAQVVSYDAGTGVLAVSVVSFSGSGTKTDWQISMTGPSAVSSAMAPVVGASSTGLAAYMLGVRSAKRKNQIINGNFAIDIRNKGAAKTIVAGAAPVYTVDRFYASCTGANAVVQQVPVGLEKRLAIAGNTGCTGIKFGTRLISENSGGFSGSNCTLSVSASGPTFTLNWEAYAPTGPGNNGFGTLAAPTRTLVASGSMNFVRNNDTESRKHSNLSLGNKFLNGTDLQPVFDWGAVNIEFSISGAAAANSNIFIGDIQLENGDVPTIFQDVGIRENQAECEFFCRETVGTTRFVATSGAQVSDTHLNWPKMYRVPTVSTVSTVVTANATGGNLLEVLADSARLSISSAAAGDCYLIGRRFLLDSEV